MTLKDNLIGKKFKRNKYGLSTWTDEITSLSVIRKYYYNKDMENHYWTPQIIVHGTNTNYYIDEIVIVD